MTKAKFTCVLCGGPASKRGGEHALSEQFLRVMNEANTAALGPSYRMSAATYCGGRFNEDRELRDNERFKAISVPCCSPCNGWLNKRFEWPVTGHLPLLLEGEAFFNASATVRHALAEWLAKTMLMVNHPDRFYRGLTWRSKPKPGGGLVRGLVRDMAASEGIPEGLPLWGVLSSRESPALLRGHGGKLNIGLRIRGGPRVVQFVLTDSRQLSVSCGERSLKVYRLLVPCAHHARCA